MEKPEKGTNNSSASRIKFNVEENDSDPSSPYKKAQMSLNTHLSFHLEPKPNPLLFTSSYKQVYLDEANKELVIIKDDNTILRQPTDQPDKKPENYGINTIGIRSAKFSPDHKYLSIQKNDTEIEFINLKHMSTIKQSCKTSTRSPNKILDFFWANASNFFYVTQQGVELYKFYPLKLIKEFKHPVNWFVYSPHLRILLTTSGPKSSLLQGYHFTLRPNNVIKLPQFFIDLAPNDGGAIKPHEIAIAQLYSRVYCIHIYNKKQELVLYHLTKDNVIKKLGIDLHTNGTVFVHVIDNLLITHNIEQKVSMLFDIKAKNAQEEFIAFPLAAPLPLSPFPNLAGDVKANNNSSSNYDGTADLYPREWSYHIPSLILDRRSHCLWQLDVNYPALCVSVGNRIKLVTFLLRRSNTKQLLLNVIQAALEEREALHILSSVFDMLNSVLAAYAQESKNNTNAPLPNGTAPPSLPKPGTDTPNLEKSPATDKRSLQGSGGHLVLESNSDLTSKRTERFWNKFVSSIGVLNNNNNSNSDSNNLISPRADEQNGHADHNAPARTWDGYLVIDQEDIYTQVFVPVEEKGVLDFKFLVAVVVEYIRSLNFHQLSVHSYLYELVINLLIRNNRYYQLHQFLQYHVVTDSMHVACQLLSLETIYPPAHQLALDMLKRLKAHDQILEVFLTQGNIFQALKFLKSHGNIKVSPLRFLELAEKLKDDSTFYTVYQFFDERNMIDLKTCDKYVRLFKAKFPGEVKL